MTCAEALVTGQHDPKAKATDAILVVVIYRNSPQLALTHIDPHSGNTGELPRQLQHHERLVFGQRMPVLEPPVLGYQSRDHFRQPRARPDGDMHVLKLVLLCRDGSMYTG